MPFHLEEARSRLAGLERVGAAELRADIAVIARPRLTGSIGAAEIERVLRLRFERLGYETRVLPFSFSTLPGRFGLSVAGAVTALAGGSAAVLLVVDRAGWSLVVLVLGLAMALVPLLALERAIGTLRWGRTDAHNLLFQRPDRAPSWILMAHRDSKSQLVPTIVRTGAIAAGALAALTLIVFCVLAILTVGVTATLVVLVGTVMAAAGVTLAFSWTSNTSPGALDNATGVAALLAVAERLASKAEAAPGGAGEVGEVGEAGDVAFLLTDAEELGLAGSRAVTEGLPPVQGVINVDGLDDRGRLVLVEGSGRRGRRSAPQLVAALLTAARALGLEVERRPVPRTVMVDHLPLVRRGIPSLTVMRGRLDSLLRVHTPSDTMDALRGTGAAEAATLLLAAVRLLQADEASHLAGRRAVGS